MIFVATRADTAALAEKLAGDGFSAMPLSGELAQTHRTRTLNAFRAGTVAVLVATDVAARGLDVPDVATVIHADLPMDGEVYTHRSGRTGRAGRKGRSVLLATVSGERRARRIFADARVDAGWQLVPSAAAVDKSLTKRMRRRVRKTIVESIDESVDTTNEAALEFAGSLLEGRDPARVIAALLAGMPSERARDPFDLETPMPRSTTRTERAGRAARDDRANQTHRSNQTHRANQTHRTDRSHRSEDSKPRDGAFTRFRINWGFRNGANPRRLLAAICRRGDVASQVIGAIDIDAYSATFDVANDAASSFELGARRPDTRDPNQRIERVAASPGQKRIRGAPRSRAS